MKPRGKKYGAPLYAIEWSDSFAYMCGGGNNGIENKYVVAIPLPNFPDRSTHWRSWLGPYPVDRPCNHSLSSLYLVSKLQGRRDPA